MTEQSERENEKKRVAVIVTEYRFNSHTDVILGRLLRDMNLDIEYSPRIEVISLYTDQVPHNDMSREAASRCNIPIYPTIGEAVKAQHHGQPIDGVIIIGEHGDYPTNEKRQKMYPRYRLLKETLEALDEIGLRVPIFSDKHLSYDMNEAIWMYEQMKQRDIPFMGGSSIPHTPRIPDYDPARLETATEWFVISYSTSVEAYGFHGLEVLQSIADQRKGGETGVRSVWALEGDEVWKAMDRGQWPEELMFQALAAFPSVPEGHPRDTQPNTVLFAVEYVDGTKGYVIQFPTLVAGWGYAFRSDEGVVSAMCGSGTGRPFSHFATLTRMIEAFIISGQPPFPMERTLMTTGLTHYGMESLYIHKPIDTPRLNIQYKT